jgi:hypothetical protein
MAVKNLNPKDIIFLYNLLNITGSIVNKPGAIRVKYNEDRASTHSSLNGDAHFGFNSERVGTIEVDVWLSSDAKTLFMAQMNLQATAVIVVKNLAQITDLAILSPAAIKSFNEKSFGKFQGGSSEMTFIFEGKLIAN